VPRDIQEDPARRPAAVRRGGKKPVAGRTVRRAGGLAALALIALGCGRGGSVTTNRPAERSAERPYLLERVGEFAIARLYADSFHDLSRQQRILAYYLSRAAIAGRDIYYDQMGRDNLEVRDLLEEILTHPGQVAPSFRERLLSYLKLFWINNGNHNDRTKLKFVPEFTYDDLREAAEAAARGGAEFRLALGEVLRQKLERLRPVLFDLHHEPLVTCKSPPPGQDILACSSVNYYEGVRLQDLKGFREAHPLNSTLVRRDGGLVEEVWRAGRGAIPAGRYARELKTMIGFLDKARAAAGAEQAGVLGDLVDYFATGDPEAFRRYNLGWVREETPVDTVNGFIETYKDPRSQKGAYEGIVYVVNPGLARTQKALAGLAQYFEDRAPWDDRYKRHGFTVPIANAVDVLVAVGDGGPMPAIGINLPNEESIRERYGNKSVSLVNVMDSHHGALESRLASEFVLPADRPLVLKYGTAVVLLETTMHEALGHASGKVSEALRGDPADALREYYAALEEARAELVALYHLPDPRLVEIGALPSPDAVRAAYSEYAAHDLYMLRRVRQGNVLEDDHMRATHLIVSYLREVTHAVEEVRDEGRTYQRVTDIGAMRRGLGQLLAEVQRIKGEGDYDAARRLMERFAIRIDPRLRDEMVVRADRVEVPSYVAYVMPDILPVRDASGEVVDARVADDSDFATQMLRYSGKLPFEPPAPADPAAGGRS
jgi:dipeptidyl-peptidase-3